MDFTGIEKLISLLSNLGLGVLIGGGVVYLFIKNYIPSYLSKKAQNLATKEDIEEITDKVESVKSEYAHLLEEVKSNNQMKLAAVEREKNTKKEVFMEAIEAVTNSQNTIPSFSNLNLSEEQITSNMASNAGKIAKVQVVGSKETVKAVTEYMSAVGKSVFELTLDRSQLVSRKSHIHTLEGLRNKSQQEIDRYIAIMKNLNLEDNSDPALWGKINSSVDYEQKQYEKYQAEIDEQWKIQNKEHLAYTRKCMGRFYEITSLLPNAVLSVRNELDIEISPDDYLNIFNQSMEEGKKIFEEFLELVEKEQV